jgi:hypothetical protein
MARKRKIVSSRLYMLKFASGQASNRWGTGNRLKEVRPLPKITLPKISMQQEKEI